MERGNATRLRGNREAVSLYLICEHCKACFTVDGIIYYRIIHLDYNRKLLIIDGRLQHRCSDGHGDVRFYNSTGIEPGKYRGMRYHDQPGISQPRIVHQVERAKEVIQLEGFGLLMDAIYKEEKKVLATI